MSRRLGGGIFFLTHTVGYMGDGFYRSKDPTNNIKVLKEHKDYTINRKAQ